MGWICTHVDPCVARMRTRHRSGSRMSEGRPPTSPIAPAHLSERPACVIGSDRAAIDELADILAEFAAADVDRLVLSRRSVDQLSRRDYGLIVIDARADDSLALLNELTRRLSAARRRDCTLVVCHESGPPTPALERLVRQTSAGSMSRPIDAPRFMAAISGGPDRTLTTAAS